MTGEVELTVEERTALDAAGFVVRHDVLDSATRSEMIQFIGRQLERQDEEGMEHPPEPGTTMVFGLARKCPSFHVLGSHPWVRSGAAHVLGGTATGGLGNFRSGLPGMGHQPLHSDFPGAPGAPPWQGCQVIWSLGGMDRHNGTTRLVPGSHLRTETPQDVMDNTLLPHPEEILLELPPGSVALVNSHVWHGGTQNMTFALRYAVFGGFSVAPPRDGASTPDPAKLLPCWCCGRRRRCCGPDGAG